MGSHGKRQETGWGNISAVCIISDYHPEYANLYPPEEITVSSIEKVGKGYKKSFSEKEAEQGNVKLVFSLQTIKFSVFSFFLSKMSKDLSFCF